MLSLLRINVRITRVMYKCKSPLVSEQARHWWLATEQNYMRGRIIKTLSLLEEMF